MPLWTPPGPCFQWHITNLSGRPASTSGTQITAGASNAKGSYTEIISGTLVTHDVYAILIDFRDGNTAADNCEILADLGYDPTNSSSYTIKINNLQCGHATNFDGSTNNGALGGIPYYFPVFFPAGTQFAFRGQTNSASTKNVRVVLHLYGKPKYPHLARSGAFVDTFGANTAISQGVTITPGTASEGAWADASGADTTKSYWHWEMGMSTSDLTMTNNIIYFQELAVGDGSNKYIVIEDQDWVGSGAEALAKNGSRSMFNYYEVGPGVRPYVRSQCSTTADSSMSAIVYAVGG